MEALPKHVDHLRAHPEYCPAVFGPGLEEQVFAVIGLMPLVKVFTNGELDESLIDAGFTIEHRWQPGKGKAVFIVAKK